MEHKEVVQIVAKYLGHIIALGCLLQIYLIYFIKRHEFLKDLRGKDLTWQLLEISAIAWYMLFPTLVIVNLFGLTVDSLVWGSLDFIYAANLGYRGFDKYVNAKFGANETKNSTEVKKNEQII